SGSIEKSSAQVFRGQSRVCFENVSFAGTAAKFAQNVLHSDAGPLEYGFAHHDPWLLFDVVLPIHRLIVSWTLIHSTCRGSVLIRSYRFSCRRTVQNSKSAATLTEAIHATT